jgi:acyl carrier protein
MEQEMRIKQIIAKELSVSEDSVVPDDSFADTLSADSTDFLELVIALEYEFDIEITEEDIEKIHTVKDMFDCVKIKS